MCALISNASYATNLSINVYLKLKPENQVASLITDFNHFLQKKEILGRYHIIPFLNKHPLHVTLYLTTYEERRIPQIMKQVQVLAKWQKKIPISTRQFITNDNGYVMLTVKDNDQLQQLSNKTINLIANLRDKKALIPAWAAKNPQKAEAFEQYGSPNVFANFKPHFSIFDAEQQDTKLYEQLQKLIIQFSKKYQIHVNATAFAIGIGIADPQGQIVNELALFKLS